MRRFWLAVLPMSLLLAAPGSAGAQAEEGEDLVNLFFDCQASGCFDPDYFRREIPFVNWVRDREVADVHVLITSEETGGGGRLYTVAFIGLVGSEGRDAEITLSTPGDATRDEQRSLIAERVKLGLVPYAQSTPAADRLRVVYGEVTGRGPGDAPGGGGDRGAAPEDDPWDFWVFRINANGFLNGQKTSSFSNLFGRITANRTTEKWKLGFGGNFSRNVQSFEISDGSTVEEIRRDWGANALAVRSLSDRWSVGARADIGSSTFVNQDLRWSVEPGIEYNFFPYAESSRRSLTLQYLVGPSHFDYTQRTIFDETE